MKRLLGAQSGAALTHVALLLVALAGLLALGVDIGHAYTERWRMQNAADAAALAGTRALFLGQDAEQAAIEYAQRNGAEDVTVVVDAEQQTVQVTAKADFPTFVASVLGVNTLAADNPAKATHGAVSELSEGVLPIAVNWQDFQYGQTYDIYAGIGPGNFGWLGWDGCGDTPCLCQSLTPSGDSERYVNPYDAYDHMLSIGDWVPGSTGIENATCVRSRLDSLMANQTPVTIVAWDQAVGSEGNIKYHVAGFAQFILENYCLPSQNRITGRFVKWLIPTTHIRPGAGFGVHGVKLIE